MRGALGTLFRRGRNKPRLLGAEPDRLWELDFLRGACVVMMIADHFLYSALFLLPEFNGMFGTNVFAPLTDYADFWWDSPLRLAVRPIVIACFFTLCGISCALSRDNFRRSSEMLAVSFLIAAATYVVERFAPESFIPFGVVTVLALSVFAAEALLRLGRLIFCGKGKAARWAARLLPGAVGIALLAVYFALFGKYSLAEGFVPTAETRSPVWGLWSFFVEFAAVNGDPRYVPLSADYFTFLPWAAFTLVGCAIGFLVYRTPLRRALRPLDGKWDRGLCFFGRHALLLYVLHQVVIAAFFFAAALFASL